MNKNMLALQVSVLVFALSGCLGEDEYYAEKLPGFQVCSPGDTCVFMASPCERGCGTIVNLSHAAENLDALDDVYCGFGANEESACYPWKCPACMDGVCGQVDCDTDQQAGWPYYPSDFHCPTDDDPDHLCDTPNPPDPWYW